MGAEIIGKTEMEEKMGGLAVKGLKIEKNRNS